MFFFCRIKEESSSEIQFPVLDENDELNDAEQLLQLEGQYIDLTILLNYNSCFVKPKKRPLNRYLDIIDMFNNNDCYVYPDKR